MAHEIIQTIDVLEKLYHRCCTIVISLATICLDPPQKLSLLFNQSHVLGRHKQFPSVGARLEIHKRLISRLAIFLDRGLSVRAGISPVVPINSMAEAEKLGIFLFKVLQLCLFEVP